MKTFLRLTLLAALAAGVLSAPALRASEAPATPPPATPPSRMQQRREERMQFLDQQLKLSADQKTRIGAIWDKADQQIRDLRQDDQTSRRARWRQVRKIMQGTHVQVRAVLTPDQQKIFDALPHQGRPPRKQDGPA